MKNKLPNYIFNGTCQKDLTRSTATNVVYWHDSTEMSQQYSGDDFTLKVVAINYKWGDVRVTIYIKNFFAVVTLIDRYDLDLLPEFEFINRYRNIKELDKCDNL